MDRLKLMLPGDVKKVSIEEIKRKEVPDLTITHNEGFSLEVMANVTEPFQTRIRSTTPEIKKELAFELKLDTKTMLQNGISLDQVWKALFHTGDKAYCHMDGL